MKKPSRITVPRHAHPLARFALELMRKHGYTYLLTEIESGVLVSTIKGWRSANTPSLQSIAAVLGVFGWRLVPCPPIDDLPADVREQLEAVGQLFVSDDETLAAAIVAATTQPGKRGTAEQHAPKLEYRGSQYWQPMESAA